MDYIFTSSLAGVVKFNSTVGFGINIAVGVGI